MLLMEGCSGAHWSRHKQEPFGESLAFRIQATIGWQPLPNPHLLPGRNSDFVLPGNVIVWYFAWIFPNMKCPDFQELAMN